MSPTRTSLGAVWASACVSMLLLFFALPVTLVSVMKSDPCGVPSDGFICSARNQTAVAVFGIGFNAVAYVVMLGMNLWRRTERWAWGWPLLHVAVIVALLSVPSP